jgi:hypothetical protein
MTTKPSTTTRTRELEPCPLLGHVPTSDVMGKGPHVHVSGAKGTLQFYSVVCNGCCSTASYESEQAAIDAWNTRAVPSTTEQVVRLREALEAVIARFQQEYRELTDGQFGTVEDFHEIKAARAALQP